MKKPVILLLILLLIPALLPVCATAELTIWFLDVGQGDCTVIVCDGASMIIDGGPPAASQKVHAFLTETLELDRLDYMISTHPHEDHISGLAAALKAVPTEHILTPVVEWDAPRFKTFMEYVDIRESRVTVPKEGDLFQLGSAVVQILHCWPEAAQWPGENVDPVNDMSIVVRIEYGNTSYIITGDAEAASEYMMIDTGLPLQSNVLRVAHHGSKFSTTEEFLKAVSPEYAVISCGRGNAYYHPNNRVLALLKENDVKLFRTDLQGTIRCESDGETILFTTERNASEEDLYTAPVWDGGSPAE